jgi:hypothetical protein
MRYFAAVLFVLATVRSVHAESNPSDDRFGVAVSSPLSWTSSSFAGSLYYAPTRHQVLRLNVASYANQDPLAFQLAALGAEADDDATLTGRTTDVGAGWMYFPRRAWRGLFVETGALVRVRRLTDYDSNSYPELQITDTQVIAARALAGWSWRVFDRGFIAIAAGASGGYEWGKAISQADDNSPTVTTRVAKFDPEFECFMRLGATFDR